MAVAEEAATSKMPAAMFSLERDRSRSNSDLAARGAVADVIETDVVCRFGGLWKNSHLSLCH